MATLEANIREIRRTVFGRDMRKPSADALLQLPHDGDEHGELIEEITEFKNEKIQESTDEKNRQLQNIQDKLPRLIGIESRHASRVGPASAADMRDEIEWIEIIEHIIHDPPTMYRLTGNNNVTVSVISDDDYKLKDAGSSASLISDDEYKMIAGSNYSSTAIDDPTHIEYEQIIHYVPNYRLAFRRASDS